MEVLESCRETHSGDYGEDGTDDSDDEEIIPANDMVGVKQPIMHVDKHQKEKDRSEDNSDDKNDEDNE